MRHPRTTKRKSGSFNATLVARKLVSGTSGGDSGFMTGNSDPDNDVRVKAEGSQSGILVSASEAMWFPGHSASKASVVSESASAVPVSVYGSKVDTEIIEEFVPLVVLSADRTDITVDSTNFTADTILI